MTNTTRIYWNSALAMLIASTHLRAGAPMITASRSWICVRCTLNRSVADRSVG
jgi:hypothetical protein